MTNIITANSKYRRKVLLHAKGAPARTQAGRRKGNAKSFSLRILCIFASLREFLLSIAQRSYLINIKINSNALKKAFFLTAVIIALLFSNSVSAKGLLQSIEDDYTEGKISHGQLLVYRMLSLYDRGKLPAKYQDLPLEPIKSSTFLRAEIRAHWDKLSSAEKALVQPFLYRPSLSDSITSPSGRFKIHYTTTGSNQTTIEFAEEAARTFDYCYQLEVEDLKYDHPPPDNGIDGPEMDVYIIDVPHSEYGSTTPEHSVPETERNDWTSWIQIDNDYTHTLTKGLDGMRVTAAHEFFHTIHFGYRMFDESDRFFYEISGVWMEDVLLMI